MSIVQNINAFWEGTTFRALPGYPSTAGEARP